MKLTRLYVPDYYLLKGLELNFSERISLLIGENGSGKSSIIEVLAYIFGHLHKYFVLKDRTAAFIDGYEIEYETQYNNTFYHVYIKSQYQGGSNPFNPIIKINNEQLTTTQIEKKYGEFTNFLPTKTILFYSGVTENLYKLNEHFEKKYVAAIIKHNNPYSLKPLCLPVVNPFCYIKKEYLPIIILSLIVSREGKKCLLEDKIQIDLDTLDFSITLGKPSWSKQDTYPWEARGLVAQTFIENLFSNCDYYADINENRTVFKFTYWGVHTYEQLINQYDASAESIFQILDVLMCSDFIKEIEIKWKVNDEEIDYNRLSEGEKQLLLTWGMNFIWKNNNLLYLYDEPDAALHPKWQREFISNVTTAIGDSACAVITTHSPIMLGNAQKADVKIMNDGKPLDVTPKYYGKNNIAILSELMGVSERVQEVSDKLHALFVEIDNENAAIAKEKYAELESILGADDEDMVRAKMLIEFMEDIEYKS